MNFRARWDWRKVPFYGGFRNHVGRRVDAEDGSGQIDVLTLHPELTTGGSENRASIDNAVGPNAQEAVEPIAVDVAIATKQGIELVHGHQAVGHALSKQVPSFIARNRNVDGLNAGIRSIGKGLGSPPRSIRPDISETDSRFGDDQTGVPIHLSSLSVERSSDRAQKHYAAIINHPGVDRDIIGDHAPVQVQLRGLGLYQGP